MGHTYDQNGNAYRLTGKKHACPSCGQHTLQLYIREADGQPVNDEVGKCDRLYKCGYDLKPREYFEQHADELPGKVQLTARSQPRQPPMPLVAIPPEYVTRSDIDTVTAGRCDFLDILLSIFTAEDVERVVRRYRLGMTQDKAVIFWQIDEKGIVHEGKAMAYNYWSGGRDKTSWGTGGSKWIFSTLVGRGILPEKASSTKILFGQHLLSGVTSSDVVCIAEAEKTTIFGAIAFPEYIWLGTGSATDLGKVWKVKRILSGCKKVIFVPDSDAVSDWEKKAEAFQLPNAAFWNICQGHPHGTDIADIIRDHHVRLPEAKVIPRQRQERQQEPARPRIASRYEDFMNETNMEVKLAKADAIAQEWMSYPSYNDERQAEAWKAMLFSGSYRKAVKDNPWIAGPKLDERQKVLDNRSEEIRHHVDELCSRLELETVI